LAGRSLARVLITGGAGFIANHLSDLLMFRWFNGLYMSENEMTFLNSFKNIS